MEAGLDRNWLLGDPEWWNLGGTSPADFRPGELPPPEKWVSSTPYTGNSGWIRQRLRPLAWGILRPMAWAPFFLAASSFPLAFPGRTQNDQLLATAFFLASWALVILPLAFSRNSQPMSDSRIKSLPVDWISIIIASFLFPFHIIFDPLIGWVSYTIFWVAYFRTVLMVQKVMLSPPSRFLLPFNSGDWPGDLGNPWKIESRKWARRNLASVDCDHGRLVIGGISKNGHDFLALAFIHKSGFLQDPFHESTIYCEKISSCLDAPLPFFGKEWPQMFLVVPEEE